MSVRDDKVHHSVSIIIIEVEVGVEVITKTLDKTQINLYLKREYIAIIAIKKVICIGIASQKVVVKKGNTPRGKNRIK